MMIEEAARNDALKAIVSEGAGIRSVREAREVTGGGADKWLQVVAMASMTAGTAIFSNHSPPGNLKDLVQRISPRPIFLTMPPGPGRRSSARTSTRPPASPSSCEQTARTLAGTTPPQAYERRVVRFFRAPLSAPEFPTA